MTYVRRAFSGVPNRAGEDNRLRQRHFRVLIAVCRAYNAQTGLAHVSQAKLADWSRYTRQYVNTVVQELVALGYVKVIRRTNGQRSQFKCNIYEIIYEPEQRLADAGDHDLRVDTAADTGSVDSGVDTAVSPSGPTHSDFSFSEVSSSETGEGRSVGKSAFKTARSGAMGPMQNTPKPGAVEIKAIEDWRARQQQEALERIKSRLSEDDWLTIINMSNNQKVFDAALSAEMRNSGAGSKYIFTTIARSK